MEQPNFEGKKEAKKSSKFLLELEKKETDNKKKENPHAEALGLVEKHKDFFEHYAKGKVKISPAPEGLNTFAFDLKNNTIYVNSMFYKKLGLSEEKTIFATLHEIEHFQEKIQTLSEENGQRNFEKYLKKIEASRAFSMLDNCVADIRENRTVVSKTNTGMKELEEKTYKEDLFKETNFLSQPRHIQFCNTILREARVPDEKCVVAEETRQALDEIAKVEGLMDIMTNPETPMSTRLKLQDKYLLPKMKELLKKDIEDRKKQKGQKEGGGEGENKNEGTQGEQGEKGEDEGAKKENPEKKEAEDKEKKGKMKEILKKILGKKEKAGTHENSKGNFEKKETEKEKKEETDPNKIFAEDYKEAEKKFPEAVPLEEIKKAFEKWKKEQKDENSGEKSDREYAEKIGVRKEDLQEYRRTVEALQKVVNPETQVSVIEELKNIFARIISKRQKPAQSPRYPVEEGDVLVDPAQLVSDVKSGNLESKVWEDTEIKEKKGDKFGEVEITLVCDKSGSMQGQKAVEQRKSAVLIMEGLKEFAEMCEEEKINMEKSLEVKSEIYAFSNRQEDRKPLKKMSGELGEAERINIFKELSECPGEHNNEFVCFEAIYGGLDEESEQKIKEGKLKKIVIILTDGECGDFERVQSSVKKLRESGVVTIGVGITNAGRAVLSTYAPNALVVENVQDLSRVMAELLKEHLKDV